MENEVKKSYEKINISDSAQSRIKESILSDNSAIFKSRNKSALLGSKAKVAAVACLTAVLLVPTGTYAAQKIYQYYKTTVSHSGEYNVDVKMNKTESDENINADKQQYVKLVCDFGTDYYLGKNYIMKGYHHKDGFESGKDFWYELLYLDGNMEETISNYDNAINETLSINGRKAIYSEMNSIVGTQYINDNRYKTEYGQVLYIFLEDCGYIIEFVAQKGLDKEEMLRLAEGIEVQMVDSKQDASKYELFSKHQDGAWSLKGDYILQSGELKNYYTKEASLGGTTFKIKDVQVLDNINGLDSKFFNKNHFKMDSLVTEDGKLIEYDRELLEFGDGVNEPERRVAKTEKIQAKLVYVTLEIENSDAITFDDRINIPKLQYVTKKDGKIYEMSYQDKYNRPEVIDDACKDNRPCYIEGNLGGDYGWAVKASKDTQTVHVAYLVDEDFVDDISLWLNCEYLFSNDVKYCLEISK